MRRLPVFLFTLFIAAAACDHFDAHAGDNVFREFGKDAKKAGKQAGKAGKAGKKVGKDIGKPDKKVGKTIKDETQELFRD